MFMSMNEEQKNQKFDKLLDKSNRPLITSALLMLKRIGRCKFRPTEVEIDEEVRRMLEEEGVLFSRPKIPRGSLITLR